MHLQTCAATPSAHFGAAQVHGRHVAFSVWPHSGVQATRPGPGAFSGWHMAQYTHFRKAFGLKVRADRYLCNHVPSCRRHADLSAVKGIALSLPPPLFPCHHPWPPLISSSSVIFFISRMFCKRNNTVGDLLGVDVFHSAKVCRGCSFLL